MTTQTIVNLVSTGLVIPAILLILSSTRKVKKATGEVWRLGALFDNLAGRVDALERRQREAALEEERRDY